MVIPHSSLTSATVKITYHTVTDDGNLKDGYSDVTNVISKVINVTDGASGKALFLSGNAYEFNIVLGMTSVDITATVQAWDEDNDDTAVDLPINVAPAP